VEQTSEGSDGEMMLLMGALCRLQCSKKSSTTVSRPYVMKVDVF